MKLAVISCFLSLWFVSIASAAEISPTVKLRRASLLITGMLPKESQYQAVQIDNSGREFAKAVDKYLESEEFVNRMEFHIGELIRLQLFPIDSVGTILGEGAVRSIVRQTFSKNLPWDSLFLSDKFAIDLNSLGVTNESLPSPLEFYPQGYQTITGQTRKQSALAQKFLKNTRDGLLSIDGNGSPMFAGIITTPEFHARYADSVTNVGRRRSAAIFRIMLCDSMAPAVTVNAAEDLRMLELALSGPRSMPAGHGGGAKLGEEHGKDPQCMICHYKLDPMAGAIRGNARAIEASTLTGTVTFRRENDELLEIKGTGIGEIAKKLVDLREYERCQVRHFWNWYVGQDVPLSNQKLDHWVTVFNRVGRRPKDFVRQLVKSPDFSHDVSLKPGQDVSLPQVASILQRCSDCHAELDYPSFNSNLIGGSERSHQSWIKAIARTIDFHDGGINTKMPPSNQEWQLSKRERALLFNWLAAGARDDSGKPTLTPDQISAMAPRAKIPPVDSSVPTFGYGYHRILDSDALSKRSFQFSRQCFTNKPTGVRNVRTGEFDVVNANGDLIKRASICAEDMVEQCLSRGSCVPTKGGEAMKFLKYLEPGAQRMWTEIPTHEQTEIVRSLLYGFVGPRIVLDEDRLIEQLVIKSNKYPKETLAVVAKRIAGWIGGGVKEFISL